jgi:hypothetical protein
LFETDISGRVVILRSDNRKIKISRDGIFNENLNNTHIFTQPFNNVSDVGVLSDIREFDNATAFNDRATVSDSVISTNSAESTDVDIYAIVEPFYGCEQPEVRCDSS